MAGLVRPSWSILSGRGKEGGKEGRRMFLEQPHIWCLFLFLEPAQAAGQDKPL